ncbi:type VII secretion target [Amycolatopsis sp. NPDC023774]|uniref:type VII secretion target n=1 Tax=Amycolatopsis sp. NPDC023774 TaxID=3155015 RepID=UPI0033DE08E0
MSHDVDPQILRNYASGTLPHYKDEATKFGNLVNSADVTDKSWGLIGLAVKQTYTSKLEDLRQMLELMKTGVDTLGGKLNQAAEIYDGHEKDTVMAFGKFKANIDGPL